MYNHRDTYSVVVPTNVTLSQLIQNGNKDDSLYNFAIPFTTQLCFRYLNGLDLELHNREDVSDIMEIISDGKDGGKDGGKINSEQGLPKFLLIFSVSNKKNYDPTPIEELPFPKNRYQFFL